MDTAEILEKVRGWVRSVGTTLGYIWSTRKVLIIAVFVLVSVGLIVWARFGFRVEYSRFFAQAPPIDDGCTSDFPRRSTKANAWFEAQFPFVNLDLGDRPVCENEFGQVHIFPTEFPGCLEWGYNQNRYEEFTESRVNDPDSPSFIVPGGELGESLFQTVQNISDPGNIVPNITDPFFFGGGNTFRLHERYLVAEGIVQYNNCPWDVKLRAAYPGSYTSAFPHAQGEAMNTGTDDLDIPSDFSFGTEPTDFGALVFPSCTSTVDGSGCVGIGFEVEMDTAQANCGRVGVEIAFEHDTPDGPRYSWFNYRDEDIQDGVPIQPPPGDFSAALSGFAVENQEPLEGFSDLGSARLSDYLLAVVHREPGQNPNDMDPVRESMHREGKLVNVWTYPGDCTGAPGERRPSTRGGAEPVPGIDCSNAEGALTCSGSDVFQNYVDAVGKPACPGTIVTTCANGCGISPDGNAACKNADGTIGGAFGGGSTGGTSGGPSGGGNTGNASCEQVEFCPAGTVGLGAARNGAEFVDDSNLGWFNFSGGSLTLVCGSGVGGQAGKVYVGPPPPRQCPDGRAIPNAGDYRTLRATNISDYCFGNPQAAFDINFLNPTHVIDCSQHEPGYSETYTLPQGEWFFGAIGPGTATAAACVPGSSGGSLGGQACDGDGSSCPDPSGTPQAANLSVVCGENQNVLTWQNPQSLGAVVNSVLRDVSGQGNAFVFAEGGCYNSFGISTYTDTDVFAGNTYTYRVKTGASVASNVVTCEGDVAATATPVPAEPASPTPVASGPTCGDNVCSSGESCSTCADDCGTCGGTCGDGVCASNESCSSCSSDCGSCSATCGDGVCSGSETASICADDCGSPGATCGDGVCDNSESCSMCSGDCGVCGRQVPVSTASRTPTGPGEATLLAFLMAGLTAFLYVSYTHTSLFKRRELEDIGQERDNMDFRG